MLDLEQQIFKQIEKSKKILIVFPENWNGDSIASALAFFLFLKKEGYDVNIVAKKTEQSSLRFDFLPGYSEIEDSLSDIRRFIVSLDISKTKVSQIKYAVEKDELNFIISPEDGWFSPEDVKTKAGEFKYDLIIVLGSIDLESLGNIYDQNIEFFFKTTIINIDNQSANEEYGQINFIDLNAVSVSELVFYLLKNYKISSIDEDIATNLLAGIIIKTKNFKSQNITPRALLSTSELINLKARREDIVDNLYRSRTLSDLKLWGKILNNLKSELDGELIWSSLRLSDFQSGEANDNNLGDIVDELIISVPNAKIVIILQEQDEAKTKMLFYSLKNINALEFTKEYSSYGTIKIVQAIINQDIGTASLEIISELKNKLDKLR